ncbi:MAG: type IV secretory system conjugative DNA transfer family protein, partial [Leptolyngbya sp. Prado105]|nr:type IV secretory system conjugative DNA transfer family protein [Leptolyngbya sp. Prado105]
PEALDEACQKLSNCFSAGELNREREIAWKIWLQTLPITWQRLLDGRRQLYFTDEVLGLLPLACTRAIDKTGMEFISREGGMPVYLDFVTQHRSIAAIGATRRGKSALSFGITETAMAHGFSVIGLDYAREDGTTTLTDVVNSFGEAGAWFDVGTSTNNLFEMPDLRMLPLDQQETRKNSYLAFLVRALEVMVMGATHDRQLGKRIHAILWKGLSAFFTNPEIQQRYEVAYDQGFGSTAWQQMPTIIDFLELLEESDFSGLISVGSIAEALAEIRLQLLSWVQSPVGKAISQPSTVRSDAQLMIYAMRNLTNDDEAAVLALSAQALALRRALESSNSLLIIDESSVLYKYDGISQIIGQICATGGKAGIRTLIISQDPDAIYHSAAGQQILQNLSVRLIGSIQGSAVESCCQIFGYDRSVLLPNTDESFLPDRSRLCSHWLLDVDGRLQQCDYYPSPELLAIVANNIPEQQARSRVMAQYTNKFEGWSVFAQQYTTALKAGQSLDTLGQTPETL